MRILIVEPHPDDTCLSFYEGVKRLVHAGHEVSLVSVASEHYNGYRDSQDFSDRMQIRYYFAGGLEDVNFKEHRVSHYELRKQEKPDAFQREAYQIKLSHKLHEMKELLEEFKDMYHAIITNLGIYHPQHVLTAMAVEEVFVKDVYFWCDYPYIKRKYGEHIVKDVLKLGEVLCGMFVNEDEKERVFVADYPSEKGIMRFDKEGLEIEEKIIIKKSIEYTSVFKDHIREIGDIVK